MVYKTFKKIKNINWFWIQALNAFKIYSKYVPFFTKNIFNLILGSCNLCEIYLSFLNILWIFSTIFSVVFVYLVSIEHIKCIIHVNLTSSLNNPFLELFLFFILRMFLCFFLFNFRRTFNVDHRRSVTLSYTIIRKRMKRKNKWSERSKREKW